MKKLEKKFTKKGFVYTQINRIGNFALYKQELQNIKTFNPKYEVVHIKSHNGYELGGVKIPAAEVYPSSTQWGALGWTFTELSLAEKRFKKLTRGQK